MSWKRAPLCCADLISPPLSLSSPCSETPQPSFRDLFGLDSLLSRNSGGTFSSGGGGGGGGGDPGSSSSSGSLQGLLGSIAASGDEAAYAAARGAVAAAMDEAEQRALWGQFRMQ